MQIQFRGECVLYDQDTHTRVFFRDCCRQTKRFKAIFEPLDTRQAILRAETTLQKINKKTFTLQTTELYKNSRRTLRTSRFARALNLHTKQHCNQLCMNFLLKKGCNFRASTGCKLASALRNELQKLRFFSQKCSGNQYSFELRR